jgi:hypothetical protein
VIIVVKDEIGEWFSYDTTKDSLCLYPAAEEKPRVIAALQEALEFISKPMTAEATPNKPTLRLVE